MPDVPFGLKGRPQQGHAPLVDLLEWLDHSAQAASKSAAAAVVSAPAVASATMREGNFHRGFFVRSDLDSSQTCSASPTCGTKSSIARLLYRRYI